MATIKCPKCGNYIPDSSKTCPCCDTPIRKRGTEEADNLRVTLNSLGFSALSFMLSWIPYVGAGLFALGLYLAIQSLKTKRNKKAIAALALSLLNAVLQFILLRSGAY